MTPNRLSCDNEKALSRLNSVHSPATSPLDAILEDAIPEGPLPCGNWSPVRLAEWLQCPARGAWSAGVWELPEDFDYPLRPDAQIGKAMHKYAETRLLGMAPDDAAAAAADEAIETDPETWLPLVDVWESTILPQIGTPQAVEQRLEADIDGLPVTCVIDVVDQMGQIRDLKTTKRTPNPMDVIRKSLQAPLYVEGWRQTTGKTAPFMLDYLIRTKTPQAVTVAVPVTQSAIDRVRRQLAWAQDLAMNPDHIIPNPYNAYGCGGCPFVSACSDAFDFPRPETVSAQSI